MEHKYDKYEKYATLNCRGLNNELKRRQLATDMDDYKIDYCCLQETHIGNLEIDQHHNSIIYSFSGNAYKLLLSSSNTNKFAGVGFLVKANLNFIFEPINNRLCILRFKTNNLKYTLISAYAPTLINSEKNPELKYDFYNQLESVISNEPKSSILIIGGDFNAKTGSGYNQYKQNIGKFGKGLLNSNGNSLLELANRNSLALTNTLFKHKFAHRTTWVSNNFKNRRNPIRNQIDYIITRISQVKYILDSRSYSGFFIDTDHRLVITKLKVIDKKELFQRTNKNKSKSNAINIENLENKEKKKDFSKMLEDKLKVNLKESNSNEQWKYITNVMLTTATEILGKKDLKTRKSQNPEIINLSKKQKDLKNEINSTNDKNKKNRLRLERNGIMRTLHYKLKMLRNIEEEKKIEEIENTKNDSTKMFKVLRKINRNKPKEKLFIKQNENIMTDVDEVTLEITNYFKQLFNTKDLSTQNQIFIPPCKMEKPFTTEEVEKAVRKLKNNKSAGSDEIQAELLKNSPKIIFQNIADIYNKLATTGIYPEEIKKGILIPLQKSGKPKGKTENMRPIILLNLIRKILAIIMMDRLYSKIDNEIPISQAAYRSGRGTTENIFTLKILAEKAVNDLNYEINIMLLDMSKAFDSVNRNILLNDLKDLVNKDELHIFKILIEDVVIQVRNEKTLGQEFITNIGVPQGDCLSPILFTLYLAKGMNMKTNDKVIDDHTCYTKANVNSESLVEKHMEDHNYTKKINSIKTIDLQYADDLSWIGNSQKQINEIEHNMTDKLKNRNLIVNNSKTEKLNIKRNGDENWKKCKYLGSFLDTEKDISHRKQMSMLSYNTHQNILQDKKLNLKTKIRIFESYVSSIFLYNSELWTITKKIGNEIDVFQRILLRRMLKIKYPYIITNENLYKCTNMIPWTQIIKRRRLRWTGHLLRLPETTPAKQALHEIRNNYNIYKKCNKHTWKKQINNDLKDIDHNFSIDCEIFEQRAKDREWWRQEIVNKALLCQSLVFKQL